MFVMLMLQLLSVFVIIDIFVILMHLPEPICMRVKDDHSVSPLSQSRFLLSVFYPIH